VPITEVDSSARFHHGRQSGPEIDFVASVPADLVAGRLQSKETAESDSEIGMLVGRVGFHLSLSRME
jgi:hypothetical protein